MRTIKSKDEAQILKTRIHLQSKQSIIVSNLYLTPKHLPTEADDTITRRFLTEAMKDGAVVVGDVNGHSCSWYDQDETDHRGKLIEELVDDTESVIINENVPTRIPFNRGRNQS